MILDFKTGFDLETPLPQIPISGKDYWASSFLDRGEGSFKAFR